MRSATRVCSLVCLSLLCCSVLLPWALQLHLEKALGRELTHSEAPQRCTVAGMDFSLLDRHLSLRNIALHGQTATSLTVEHFSCTLTWDLLLALMGIKTLDPAVHSTILTNIEIEGLRYGTPIVELTATRLTVQSLGLQTKAASRSPAISYILTNPVLRHTTMDSVHVEHFVWRDHRLMGEHILQMAELHLHDWDGHDLAGALATDIRFAPQEGYGIVVQAASVNLQALHMPDAALWNQLETAQPAFSEAWCSLLLNGLINGEQPLCEIATLRGVSVGGLPQDKMLPEQLTLHGNGATYLPAVDTNRRCLELGKLLWPTSQPHNMHIILEDLRLPRTDMEILSNLRFPGLTTLTLGATFTSRAETAGRTRQQLAVTCPELADFSMETIYEEGILQVTDPQKDAPAGPRIAAFTLVWQDRTLATYLVGNLGSTRNALREHLQRMQLGIRSQRNVRIPLQTFLEHSGTLSLELADGKPVTLQQFFTLRDHPADILDVTVTPGSVNTIEQAQRLFSR